MKRFAKRLSLALFGLLFGLFLAELTLNAYRLAKWGTLRRSTMIEIREELLTREYGPPNRDTRDHTWENTLVLHPLFGYVQNPRKDNTNNFGFQTPCDFELTEDGYRLRGVDPDKTVVVGVFGGSFAFFTAEMAGDYLAKRIRALVPGKDVRIVNFSHGGYALPQSAFVFAYFRSLLDVAVFIDGLNEVWNFIGNNKAGCPPEYAKATHYKYRTSVDEMEASRFARTVRLLELRRRLARITDWSLRPWLRNSVLVHYVWRGWSDRINREIVGEHQAIERSFLESGEPFFDLDEERLMAICARQYGRYHRMVHELCRADGILDVHVIQPNPLVPDSKARYTDAERARMRLSGLETIVRNGYPRLRREVDALAKAGAAAADLSFVYKEQTGEIWSDSAHANVAGYRIVSDHLVRLIADACAKGGAIGARAKPAPAK